MTALALAGRLDFNPLSDTIVSNGKKLKLVPPSGDELPKNGYAAGESGFIAPLPEAKRRNVSVAIDEKSDRLQMLAPFAAWDGKDFENLTVLLKAKGKCTTDHISPAGPWLKYRGHLNKISDNMFLGAKNAFTEALGTVKNWSKGGAITTPAEAARDYKKNGVSWAAIGDENYGEGSSREHAAMSPRFLGCKAVIAKSFARIHETNLKKQGILPLKFKDPKDYEKIKEDDRLSVHGLKELTPERLLTLTIHHADKTMDTSELVHSFTKEQVAWFKAGSALNLMKGK
ncbi:MAG: hypothetical protein AUJ72_04130 [Candidatus Omnitrophica bacterium CG1_02_46_14]|nr:MAG: hypothetical protein AUJ72_04130 [Candidatus Omnitrophica bacterium CG1_02_46_14]